MSKDSGTNPKTVALIGIMTFLILGACAISFFCDDTVMGITFKQTYGLFGQVVHFFLIVALLLNVDSAIGVLVVGYWFYAIAIIFMILLSLCKWCKLRFFIRAILLIELIVAIFIDLPTLQAALYFGVLYIPGGIIVNSSLIALYEIALRKRYPEVKFWSFKKKKVTQNVPPTESAVDGSSGCHEDGSVS